MIISIHQHSQPQYFRRESMVSFYRKNSRCSSLLLLMRNKEERMICSQSLGAARRDKYGVCEEERGDCSTLLLSTWHRDTGLSPWVRALDLQIEYVRSGLSAKNPSLGIPDVSAAFFFRKKIKNPRPCPRVYPFNKG